MFVCTSASSAQTGATDAQGCQEEKAKIASYETQLKDWSQLNRYGAADLQVIPPSISENRVVFMGDSITDGWNLVTNFPGKPYINRGIGGQTTPQMLIRFRPDVIALKPKVVVILAGTNDIAGNTGPTTLGAIEDNLSSMVELARANGIKVILSSVLPVSDEVKNKEGAPIIQTISRPPKKIQTINAWLRKYTAENNLIYLDYYTAMVDQKGSLKESLTYDGLHPNESGYQVMQPLVEKAISAALKNSDKTK
ncbi:MAG: SGNH/GDSL hydrolase family protein [Pyrinomonadaceae bacterium]